MSWLKRWWMRNVVDDDPDAPILEPMAAHGCCEVCGDEGSLYLQSRCHPNSPMRVVLSGHVLTAECAYCSKVVSRFVVVEVAD